MTSKEPEHKLILMLTEHSSPNCRMFTQQVNDCYCTSCDRLLAQAASDDRNSRFAEEVREIMQWHRVPREIHRAHERIYGVPCVPTTKGER